MFSMLLTILKITGIFLLVVLGIILALVVLVLFVPIRYRIDMHRKVTEDTPVAVKARCTWLFHIVSAGFAYPEAAYVRVKVFCFTVFRTDKMGAGSPKTSKPKKTNPKEKKQEKKNLEKPADKENTERNSLTEDDKTAEEPQEEKRTWMDFFKKLWSVLKNIQYTINKICDKIKHVIKDIRYYMHVIQSNTFQRAWAVCSKQVFSLLKSILPKKLKGNLLVGTGDPAGTGQVMALYGMLYPLLGNHIDITPDFEQQIVEGWLLIKGRIMLIQVIKAAWIVYFNKNLRHLIKLLKREAA